MTITGRIEVHTLRRKIVIYGNPTLRAIERFIEQAVKDYGLKVKSYKLEFDADHPDRKSVKVKHYLITTGASFQPPDVDTE